MELKYQRGPVTGTIQIDIGDQLGDVFSECVLADVMDYADEGILESAKIIAIISEPGSHHLTLSFRGASDEA